MDYRLFFIGSLPHRNVDQALRFVEEYSSHLPFLPQLPELNPQEDMVGQVLRGIEIGYWDDKASIAMKSFLDRFSSSKSLKIQVAGPMTVGRSLSVDPKTLFEPWTTLSKGLVNQVRGHGFKGKLWLQIDEPYWESKKPLPIGYENFLHSLRQANLNIGIHTCGDPRPTVSEELMKHLDFLSMDFLARPITPQEVVFWSKTLASGRKNLIAGILEDSAKIQDENIGLLKGNAHIWVSSPCGYGLWDPNKFDKFSTEID